MAPIWRTCGPVVAAAIGVAGIASCQPASAASGPAAVNVAVAQNSRSGHVISHQAWRVVNTRGPVLFATNSAVVAATGTGSATTAFAFEIVTASETSKIVASNRASTTEVSCSSCQAAAVAEQWILAAPNGVIHLTPAGRVALQQVNRRLEAIVVSDETPTQKYDAAVSLEAQVTAALGDPSDVSFTAAPSVNSTMAATHLRTQFTQGVSSTAGESPRGIVLQEPGYTVYRYGQISLSSGNGSTSISS